MGPPHPSFLDSLSLAFTKYSKALVVLLIVLLTYIYFISRTSEVRKISTQNVGPNFVSNDEGNWLEDLKYVEQNLYDMPQDDPRLIKYVRHRYISPPATKDYNLNLPEWGSDVMPVVQKLFKNKRNGVFMESGANDGEYSHTFKLERDFGWTGILVECNPTVVPYLRSKYRKAWIAGVCLATAEVPQKFNFSNPVSWTYSGRFGKPWNLPVKTNWTFFDVETIPLYTILEAVSMTQIDFWSLDVEGSEIEILKTIPFDKVSIKVIVCEIYFFNAEERTWLNEFMKSKGYNTITHSLSIDQVYVHNSFIVE